MVSRSVSEFLFTLCQGWEINWLYGRNAPVKHDKKSTSPRFTGGCHEGESAIFTLLPNSFTIRRYNEDLNAKIPISDTSMHGVTLLVHAVGTVPIVAQSSIKLTLASIFFPRGSCTFLLYIFLSLSLGSSSTAPEPCHSPSWGILPTTLSLYPLCATNRGTKRQHDTRLSTGTFSDALGGERSVCDAFTELFPNVVFFFCND